MIENNTVSVNVKKHKVVVINETIIHIHHTKACKKPCELIKEITDYLEAELFVKDGYIVSDDLRKL